MQRMARKKVARDDRGAIGIGTLIVFIAMVLVAAIAAAVIIRTAEGLEEDAERTGTGARKDVSSAIRIRMVEGRVSDAETVDEIYVYFDLYGGSVDVRMETVFIHLLLSPRAGQPAEAYDLQFVDGENNANDTLYGVKAISDPLGSYASSQVIDGETILMARIVLRDPPDGVGRELPPDSDMSILFMPGTGGPISTEECKTPASYPSQADSRILIES